MENREEFLASHYLLEDIPAVVFAHMAAELIGGIALHCMLGGKISCLQAMQEIFTYSA